MKVIEKETRIEYDVFDITYDSTSGYPHFLIYKDGQWIRKSAKHFVPVESCSAIVRCAECRHRGTTACMMYHECWIDTFGDPCYFDYMHDDGYCHAGERWGEDE